MRLYRVVETDAGESYLPTDETFTKASQFKHRATSQEHGAQYAGSKWVLISDKGKTEPIQINAKQSTQYEIGV